MPTTVGQCDETVEHDPTSGDRSVTATNNVDCAYVEVMCEDGTELKDAGESCDDGDASTENTTIQNDRCTCSGDEVQFEVSVDKKRLGNASVSIGDNVTFQVKVKNESNRV